MAPLREQSQRGQIPAQKRRGTLAGPTRFPTPKQPSGSAGPEGVPSGVRQIMRSSRPPVDKNDRDDRQDKERLKAVELAVGQIEKQFGKGSIMRLGQKGAI